MKVKNIHDSHLFGIISEVGCSATIASHLMDEPGASNTVYYSIQPYNKSIQHDLYNSKYWSRSVSQEYIMRVLEVEIDALPLNGNFVLASSWQLNDNDPEKYCHGWFGLWLKETETKHYLHFSFERNNLKLKTRKDYLDKIGEIGIAILHAAISNELDELSISLNDTQAILDMAFISHDTDVIGITKIDYKLILNTLENSKKDYPLIFSKHGMMRAEDLARKSENLIIEKGSFQPMHKAHKQMLDISLEMIPNSLPACLISTFRYDKPHIDIDDLIQRINFINAQDYPVIICKEVYFYNTFTLLQKWFNKNNMYYPIGSDTLKRISIEDDKNCGINKKSYIINSIKNKEKNKLLLFKRIGYDVKDIDLYNDFIINTNLILGDISSTKIRNGEIKNDLNENLLD